MHLGAQLLEPLLMGDAEMLLLVDDDQAEVLELDRLAKQRMGADDDVDRAVGEAFLGLGKFGGRNEPRGLPILIGNPRKRSVKVFVCWRASSVVGTTTRPACRSSRRRRPRAARLRSCRSRRRRKSADPSAGRKRDHRPPRRSPPAGRRSPRRESRRRTRRRARARRRERRLAQLPLGGDLDQLARDLADASSSAPCATARRRRRAGRARRRPLPSRSATGARYSRPARTACRRRLVEVDAVMRAPRPRWRAGRRSGRCHGRHGRRDRRRQAVTSAMKSSARFDGRRGRTRRSPRCPAR